MAPVPDARARGVRADRRPDTPTHLVAPPGSGKTLLGFEMLRRIGGPALVLAPNSAIQQQWTAAASGVRRARRDSSPTGRGARSTCLTYQALARLDDPGDALRAAAEARWAEERPRATARSRRRRGGRRGGMDGRGGEAARPGARADRRRAQARDRARRARRAAPRRAAGARRARAGRGAARHAASGRSCSTSATTSPRSGATSCARSSRSSAATSTSSASPRRRRTS